MEYNKFTHNSRKRWLVVSVSLLAALSGGLLMAHNGSNVHASATNPNQNSTSQQAQTNYTYQPQLHVNQPAVNNHQGVQTNAQQGVKPQINNLCGQILKNYVQSSGNINNGSRRALGDFSVPSEINSQANYRNVKNGTIVEYDSMDGAEGSKIDYSQYTNPKAIPAGYTFVKLGKHSNVYLPQNEPGGINTIWIAPISKTNPQPSSASSHVASASSSVASSSASASSSESLSSEAIPPEPISNSVSNGPVYSGNQSSVVSSSSASASTSASVSSSVSSSGNAVPSSSSVPSSASSSASSASASKSTSVSSSASESQQVSSASASSQASHVASQSSVNSKSVSSDSMSVSSRAASSSSSSSVISNHSMASSNSMNSSRTSSSNNSASASMASESSSTSSSKMTPTSVTSKASSNSTASSQASSSVSSASASKSTSMSASNNTSASTTSMSSSSSASDVTPASESSEASSNSMSSTASVQFSNASVVPSFVPSSVSSSASSSVNVNSNLNSWYASFMNSIADNQSTSTSSAPVSSVNDISSSSASPIVNFGSLNNKGSQSQMTSKASVRHTKPVARHVRAGRKSKNRMKTWRYRGRTHHTYRQYITPNDFRKGHHMYIRLIKDCNEYRSTHYTRRTRIRHLHKGMWLAVRRVVLITPHITRFQLTNGNYVTSNQHFARVIK